MKENSLSKSPRDTNYIGEPFGCVNLQISEWKQGLRLRFPCLLYLCCFSTTCSEGQVGCPRIGEHTSPNWAWPFWQTTLHQTSDKESRHHQNERTRERWNIRKNVWSVKTDMELLKIFNSEFKRMNHRSLGSLKKRCCYWWCETAGHLAFLLEREEVESKSTGRILWWIPPEWFDNASPINKRLADSTMWYDVDKEIRGLFPLPVLQKPASPISYRW